MVTAYQIITFYCILGLVTTGLIGYYPYIDPEGFAALTIYADHPTKHIGIGKFCVITLMTIQIIAIFILISRYRNFKSNFINSNRNLAEKALCKKAFWTGLIGLLLGIILAKVPWLLGTKVLKGQLSAQSHFHIVALDLLLLSIALIMSGWALETISRHLLWLNQDLGKTEKVEAFIWDIHAQKFNLAKKFLFLGINVWWPYLVLKYAVGMSALSGLAFLPVHLAGVIPYSILKRKHRFKRTINPDYSGKISKRKKYEPLGAS